MKSLKFRQLAFIFVLVLFACQEDSLVEDFERIDEDMIAATFLADGYFNDIRANTSTSDRAITVLRYENGQILFNTNTDNVAEYQVVEETTITAYVEPGEFVFWYRGNGINDLEGVDFDPQAQSYLGQNPDEYQPDLMWVLKVPDNYDPNHDELKYDIVYESEDNQGVIIRLDPKIGVITNSNSSDDSSDSGNSGDSTANEG